VELTLSDHWFRKGNQKLAIERLLQLQSLTELADSNAVSWYAWQSGRLQFLSGNFLSATDHYAKIAQTESDSLVHREYVHALYRAGLLPAAHRRARAIRGKNGRVVAGITEIEADVLAQTGNFIEAQGLLLELVADRPQSSHLLLSLAKLYAATGDFVTAGVYLERLDGAHLPKELQVEANELRQILNQAGS
jgi:tetratricopeptide (TPR) repeat protein